ncbi:unnamed protein product [Ilex paraguariensis]|uniref:Uncharacterized protein n=1 Tax=Ilex paraguariensis TaxID=185542 RepID=A0ABC8UWE7_9AQUA
MDRKRVRDINLTSAEIARTAVEANNSAWLIFPSMVHCEPHRQISWAEFQYVIDEWGDIFFEISDDENILQDRGASNPVNALFGMDIPLYENKWIYDAEYDISESGFRDEISFRDDYFELEGSEIFDIPVDWGRPDTSRSLEGSEIFDIPVDWGRPDTSRSVHPVYFGKCLAKVITAWPGS